MKKKKNWRQEGVREELLKINIIKTENYFMNLSYSRQNFLRKASIVLSYAGSDSTLSIIKGREKKKTLINCSIHYRSGGEWIECWWKQTKFARKKLLKKETKEVSILTLKSLPILKA